MTDRSIENRRAASYRSGNGGSFAAGRVCGGHRRRRRVRKALMADTADDAVSGKRPWRTPRMAPCPESAHGGHRRRRRVRKALMADTAGGAVSGKRSWRTPRAAPCPENAHGGHRGWRRVRKTLVADTAGGAVSGKYYKSTKRRPATMLIGLRESDHGHQMSLPAAIWNFSSAIRTSSHQKRGHTGLSHKNHYISSFGLRRLATIQMNIPNPPKMMSPA
ncbi:hypothetical protein [Salinicoccus carnicancri]|uniref:hypothetical protein n=1 Tax=Salinicoccus carnicancri TaxID=558170 RepID=UPI0012EA7E6E|nr:hypothetical protein [Salinicoccus carnicancri]